MERHGLSTFAKTVTLIECSKRMRGIAQLATFAQKLSRSSERNSNRRETGPGEGYGALTFGFLASTDGATRGAQGCVWIQACQRALFV
jgi:hypothetical protein